MDRIDQAVADAVAVFDTAGVPWSYAVHRMIAAAEATPKYEADELITILNCRLGQAIADMSFRSDRERTLDRLRFVVSLIEERAAKEPGIEGFVQ
jgi:hypothetical protein